VAIVGTSLVVGVICPSEALAGVFRFGGCYTSPRAAVRAQLAKRRATISAAPMEGVRELSDIHVV